MKNVNVVLMCFIWILYLFLWENRLISFHYISQFSFIFQKHPLIGTCKKFNLRKRDGIDIQHMLYTEIKACAWLCFTSRDGITGQKIGLSRWMTPHIPIIHSKQAPEALLEMKTVLQSLSFEIYIFFLLRICQTYHTLKIYALNCIQTSHFCHHYNKLKILIWSLIWKQSELVNEQKVAFVFF